MTKKKTNTKKNKKFNFTKLYILVCAICLGLGLASFGVAKNISKDALKLSNQEIRIPSYNQIIKENQLKTQKERIQETETVQSNEETYINTETVQPVDVKVENITENETEKVLAFTLPCDGKLLKRFSIDKPLKSITMGDFRTHNGIDIKASIGSEVYTAEDGTVENVYKDDFLGTTVIVSHNEEFKTQYSNLADDISLKTGEEIFEGDLIGHVGNTAISEISDEPHLHFSVLLNDSYVNPQDYIIIED